MILGSGGAIEEIETALQNVGGGDAIDDFGAALSRHVMSDHLASDSGGRHCGGAASSRATLMRG